jgi:hypothetical protein
MPFDSLVGHASRIRERVIDTGSLNTETQREAFGTKAVTSGNVNPVLQKTDTASQPIYALTWRGISSSSTVQGGKPAAYNFLSEQVLWIPWSPVSDAVGIVREGSGYRIRAEAARNSAVTIKLPKAASLSNGALVLRYCAAKPLKAVITLNGGGTAFPNEIFIRLDTTEVEKQIRIPMPGTPGLESVTELVVRFGDERQPAAVDCTISGFEFN